jgi:alpha-tubulin suppressor-like RCC1 family protein
LARCWGGVSSGALSLGDSPSEFQISRWSYIGSSERDWNDNGELNIFEVQVPSDSDGDGFPDGSDSEINNPTVAADCLAGSYGRFTCRQATPGYYVAGNGNTVMTPASPGHYVDSTGAFEQEKCDIGEFQRLSGQTSCDDAEPGYFVDGLAASEGTPCPAGQYNDQYGQTSADACRGADEGHSVPVLTQVALGASHSCAILDDGSVSCWGLNSNGQLGDGTRSPSLEPEKSSMPLGRKAVEIAVGSYHTCTLLDDGTVRCWGSNEFGQLGDGTTIERTTPVSVNLGQGKSALSVSSGESHSCAILNDRSVKCWGLNSNGQLGDGTTTDRSSPVQVAMSGEKTIMVSAGSYHTCAISIDRTVMCWGDNWNGQIGDGTNTDSASPVVIAVPSNSSAVSLDAGALHTCLGMNDGSMFCWGYNAYGQLGNGGFDNSNTPMASPLSTNLLLSRVQVGLFHSCAIFDSGQVSCWGDNSIGQLGDETQIGRPTPGIVGLGTNATSISVGQRHTCAILDDASLHCWGANEAGQVGDGSSLNRDGPVAIDLGHGSKEQLPCKPGSYQPNSSQTTCNLADRGFMVSDSGQTNQTGCGAGYFSSLKGQSDCTPASRGYYVPDPESSSQIPCPAGKSTLSEASTFFDDCFADFDGDGIPDMNDDDDDNDGVPDDIDYDPLDPEVSADFDGDRIPDSIDDDDDNDGVNDTNDPFPKDQTEWEDGDGDGIGDNSDPDDDGDGMRDVFDVFPYDGNEWSDADGDGIGDNTDADDDNDGRCDDTTYWKPDEVPPSNKGPSQDGDEIPDCYASAMGDAFPFDANETDDTDGDSIGNNQDTDCDGDGWINEVPCTQNTGTGANGTDAFPLDNWRWSDSDGDGHADQGKNLDVFPDDPTEWMDTDLDSVGNNADECPYEAGISSSTTDFMMLLSLPGNDLGCPLQTLIGDEIVIDELDSSDSGIISTDQADFDGDSLPDWQDTDDDNDGIPDIEDGVLGDEKWSKDPFRPFTYENWAIIFFSVSFIGIMGYRIMGWKNRGISNIRSKRIRIQ